MLFTQTVVYIYDCNVFCSGLVTPSGVTSVPIGMETPDLIELRKKRIEDAMDQGGDTPALYQVVPEKKATVGGAMMGSAHVYDMSAVTAPKKGLEKPAGEGGGIEVSHSWSNK